MLLVLLLLLVHFLLVRYSLRAIIIIMHVYPRLFCCSTLLFASIHRSTKKQEDGATAQKIFSALILKLLQISMLSTGVSVCHDKNGIPRAMVNDGIQRNCYPNRKSLWPTKSKRMNELCVKCPQILFEAVSTFFSHSLTFFLSRSLYLSFSVLLNSIYFVFVFIFRVACVLHRFARFAAIDLFRCNNSVRCGIVSIAFQLENVSAIYEMHSRTRCSSIMKPFRKMVNCFRFSSM